MQHAGYNNPTRRRKDAKCLTSKGEYYKSVEQYEQLCVSKRICGKC